MKITNVLIIPTLFFSYLHSTTLKDLVTFTIKNNPKIKAIKNNNIANRYYIDESFGDYLPTLNYETYLQDKKITDKPLGGTSAIRDENGSYQQLKLDQNVYNGGLTQAKVEEAKHNYQSNLIANIYETEKLILDTVTSYLNLLKNEELKRLTENDLKIHNIYLETAVETENVSGDVVDRLLVENKIFTAKEKLIQIKDDKKTAKGTLEKFLGRQIDNNICVPEINYSLIPSSKEDLLSSGIKNNYTVLEEIEKIKAQKAVVSQEVSRFLPKIDFQLTQEIDDGIDVEDHRKNNRSARITLSYNFFNGLKDKSTYKREKKFLAESQKNLDNVSNEAKEKIEEQYYTFQLSKEKLDVLHEHILNNKEILKVFSEQFDGGTRSFIDVLNQEEELYRKKSNVIEEKYKNLTAYYSLLFQISMLSDTILSTDNKCNEINIDFRKIEKKPEVVSQELENLLSEDNLLDTPVEKKPDKKNIKEKVNKVFNSLLDDIYNTEDVKKIDLNSKKRLNIPNENKKNIKEKVISKSKVEVFTSDLKEELSKENSDSFTIVLGTVLDPNKPIDTIIQRYKADNIFAYRFKQNGKSYIKILSGSFKTSNDAKKSLASLDPKILRNGPFIDNINKHQRLYKRYNSLTGDKVE